MRQLYKFHETVKRLVNADYGLEFESSEQAEKDLLKDIDLSGACLLTILQSVSGVVEVVAEHLCDKIAIKHRQKMRACYKNTIDELEAKHGPCPESVGYHIRDSIMRYNGWNLWNGIMPSYASCNPVPEKGTAARKDYDAWKRKKVKKQ